MNSFSTKIVLRQFLLWCVLVIVVALLTLLFTVLGTLTCAVLTGMMMGASNHRRWQTIPISLVFPGVVGVMAHAARVELIGAQQFLLPALCFAAFWLTYLSTSAVMKLESRRADSSMKPAALGLRDPAPSAPAALAPVDQLSLEQLQGKWSSETGGGNSNGQMKLIEVVGDQISLSVIEADGNLRQLGKGQVKLGSPRAASKP